jgi:predicted nucleotidyltransferase
MDALPILVAVARVLPEQGLEAILIGNALDAVLFTPHYPVSSLYRVIRDDDQLQLVIMTRIHGVRSFNSLRSRATEVEIEGEKLTLADLTDIIASKRAADRPRDRAVLHVLQKALEQKGNASPGSGSPQTPE